MKLGETDTKGIVQLMLTSLFLYIADALFKSSTNFSYFSSALFISSLYKDSKKPIEITKQFNHIVLS